MKTYPVNQYIPEAFRAIGYIERLKRLHFERQQNCKHKFLLPDAKLEMRGSSLCLVAREEGRFPGICIDVPPMDRELVSMAVEASGGVIPASTKEIELVARVVAIKRLNQNRNHSDNSFSQKD